jgi:hypothetical protein
MYPNAMFIVYCQLSCYGLHPCSPPTNSTLLRYIHNCFSSSLGSYLVGFVVFSQRTVFFSSSVCIIYYLSSLVFVSSLSSGLASYFFIICVILSVFGVPAFFLNVEMIAAASAFSVAI